MEKAGEKESPAALALLAPFKQAWVSLVDGSFLDAGALAFLRPFPAFYAQSTIFASLAALGPYPWPAASLDYFKAARPA